MRKPNLFIVGQPKAGTTALHNFLGEHPDIHMAGLKEPFFFCKDFHEESDSHYGYQKFFHIRDEKSYLKLFSRLKSEKVMGESSAEYLYSKSAANEIHRFNSDAKIIMMLRNPVDWLYSLHNQYVNTTTEDEKDFTEALALESSRKQGNYIPSRVQCPSWLYYTERIKYYEQVKRFYDLFDSSQIKLIIFEDFRKDNAKVYQNILSFLEVDYNFVPKYKLVNVRSKPRSERLNRIVYHPVPRKISQKILPPYLYDYICKNLVEKKLWIKDERPLIQPELKNRLMQNFREEVIKLSSLTGLDLEKKWGYYNL